MGQLKLMFDASQGCGSHSAPSKRYNSFLGALTRIIIILEMIGQYKTADQVVAVYKALSTSIART